LDLKKQVEDLQEQLNLKQHKTYGPSSERAEYYGQLNMSEVFNEVEAYFTPDIPEPTVEEVWVKPHDYYDAADHPIRRRLSQAFHEMGAKRSEPQGASIRWA